MVEYDFTMVNSRVDLRRPGWDYSTLDIIFLCLVLYSGYLFGKLFPTGDMLLN
jgi:hypothetical protein